MDYLGKAKDGKVFYYRILRLEQNISKNLFKKVKKAFVTMGFDVSKLQLSNIRKGWLYINCQYNGKLRNWINSSKCFRTMYLDELFEIQNKIKNQNKKVA